MITVSGAKFRLDIGSTSSITPSVLQEFYDELITNLASKSQGDIYVCPVKRAIRAAAKFARLKPSAEFEIPCHLKFTSAQLQLRPYLQLLNWCNDRLATVAQSRSSGKTSGRHYLATPGSRRLNVERTLSAERFNRERSCSWMTT
jgi:hypothetical protein